MENKTETMAEDAVSRERFSAEFTANSEKNRKYCTLSVVLGIQTPVRVWFAEGTEVSEPNQSRDRTGNYLTMAIPCYEVRCEMAEFVSGYR